MNAFSTLHSWFDFPPNKENPGAPTEKHGKKTPVIEEEEDINQQG